VINIDRRNFLKSVGKKTVALVALSPLRLLANGQKYRRISNPYSNLDWNRVQAHKAGLHMHTLQSDGYHMVDEVVNAYRNAGYTILSITDHDTMSPNRVVRHDRIPEEMATPYPKDPRPDNFPGNTTWPWTDYGSSAPDSLGMVGIEGNELSFRHHICSYYCDVGWSAAAVDHQMEDWNDFEIESVKQKGGLAVLAHPGWQRETHRRSLEWYIERFEKHSADCLLGVEIGNNQPSFEDYDLGLWDQLLARFMLHRPIWGFSTDDMHRLVGIKQAFNSFFLPSLSNQSVRRAMEAGQFVACRSSRDLNYRIRAFRGMDTFPNVQSISVDDGSGTIRIKAQDCDEIRWISSPESLETKEDYKTSDRPWELGKVVHVGDTVNVKTTPGIKNYVRAELHRRKGDELQRVFTNPFGIYTG
jgi:hypothetical protein